MTNGSHATECYDQAKGRSLIAGQYAPAAPHPEDSGKAFRSLDPATRRPFGPWIAPATHEDVSNATQAAWEAFYANQGRSGEDRGALLDAIAQGIVSAGETLLELTSMETGLPKPRLAAERDRTVFTLKMFAGMVREGSWVQAAIDRDDPKRTPQPKPDVRRMLRPLGPVAVFGASNFPLAYSTAGTDTASALAAGCPVIVKGHPAHPLTGEVVASIITEALRAARFHPGTFSYLHAGGVREQEVGRELVLNPYIRAVGFTGSPAGGRALADLAASRGDPIPVFAEMGSVNPVFVLPQAMQSTGSVVAEKLAASATNSVGQMCTCPGLIFFVKSKRGDQFVRELAAAFDRVPAQPMLSPRVHDNFVRRLEHMTAVNGVELRTSVAGNPGGTVAYATLLKCSFETFRSALTLHDECFGPAALAVACETATELLHAASMIQGSLTASIWADSGENRLAADLLAILEQRAGRLVLNGVPTGVEVGPAMVHSGPFPACNRPDTTAVGPFAAHRWCRPVAYQNFPNDLLPAELRDSNPLRIFRVIDGKRTEPMGS